MAGSPARWAEIKAVFEAALDLPPGERAAALAASGLDDAALAEVRSLLQHHEEATSADEFLSTPAALDEATTTDLRPAPARPGQRLGAWEVVRPLGAGGMGEVFEARRADGSYEGRAAVKLLKRGMDSAAVLQRFAQERNALARLNHPHIARLLDAGASAQGLPYFVMEYVDGKPIHEAAGSLPLEQRLQLFQQLARAVAHAHRNLLVHRDLKPGNVLVDGEGQVKLLDFGIAKALDPVEDADGDTTAGGVRPFTPHYASPEQVRGEPVTTATDIYSLGVLLYQLLTGLRPTGRHATTPAEAARSVLDEQPTRPSRLSPQESPDPLWLHHRKRLQGDLDNILLKALEKQPERRYASVDAMSADIERYLNGHPVSARPASAGYVLAKFVQRHRWAVLTAGVGALGLATALAATVLQGRLAAAAGVLLLVAGLVMALLQALRAQRASREAALARDDARRQLERVKRITADLVFRYGDTVTLLPGGAQALEALLRDSVTLMEPALQGAPDDLDLAVTMVCALGRLAEIQGNTATAAHHDLPAAHATVARGLALADRAWAQRLADWRFASWHVRTLVVKAELLRVQKQLEPALDALHRAADRAEESLARQHDAEGRLYMAGAQASAHLTMAQVLDHAHMAHLGRPADALREYRRAEHVYRDMLKRPDDLAALDRKAAPGDVSTEAYVRHQLGSLLGGRALVHLRQDDLAATRADAEAALALCRQNVQGEPLNLAWRDGLAVQAHTLSLALLRLGDTAQALATAELAWETAQGLSRDQGADGKWTQPHLHAMLASARGPALRQLGRAAEALSLLEPAAQHWRAQGQAPDAQCRAAWFDVQCAAALLALGRSDAARLRAAAAAEQLAALGATGPQAREALLARAEAHALLLQCAPGEQDRHRAQALSALAAAQALRPLAQDHQRLLASLAKPGA